MEEPDALQIFWISPKIRVVCDFSQSAVNACAYVTVATPPDGFSNLSRTRSSAGSNADTRPCARASAAVGCSARC